MIDDIIKITKRSYKKHSVQRMNETADNIINRVMKYNNLTTREHYFYFTNIIKLTPQNSQINFSAGKKEFRRITTNLERLSKKSDKEISKIVVKKISNPKIEEKNHEHITEYKKAFQEQKKEKLNFANEKRTLKEKALSEELEKLTISRDEKLQKSQTLAQKAQTLAQEAGQQLEKINKLKEEINELKNKAKDIENKDINPVDLLPNTDKIISYEDFYDQYLEAHPEATEPEITKAYEKYYDAEKAIIDEKKKKPNYIKEEARKSAIYTWGQFTNIKSTVKEIEETEAFIRLMKAIG